MLRRLPSVNPILTWTGAASGSQNLLANGTLNFTTTGTYTFTVNRPVRLSWICAAPGYVGALGGPDGGRGGGAGAISNALQFLFVPGVTYELTFGAQSSTTNAVLKIQGSTVLIEAGAANLHVGGAMVTGAGTAGGDGGLGGTAGSLDADGKPGTTNGAAGGGGGGGAEGAVDLGGGGSGGGESNGTPSPGPAPGTGLIGGVGHAPIVAGIAVSRGGGGGGQGASPTGASAGNQGAAQAVFVP